MYHNSIKIKQHDITDCGAACLASICAFHGLKYPIARIRQLASTDQKGTNVLGLMEAAETLKFSVKGVKADYDMLEYVPMPSIAHVVVKETLQHYVVLYKVTPQEVTYMDPADGKMHKKRCSEFKQEWTGVLVIMEPRETFERGNKKTSMMQKFFRLISPHRSVMIQALFGALVYSVLGLSMSVYVGKITDSVLIDENLNLLHLMGIVMFLILALRTFIGSMKSILALKTGQRIDAALILGYYKHLLTLPQQFFDTMRVGEIISRVNDAVKIRNFINNVSLDIAVNFMILLFSVGLMVVYSWKLALVTLSSAPLFLLVYWLFNKLNRKYQRDIMESSADLESQLVESVNAIGTIKRFGIEDFANLKTESRFVKLLRNTYHSILGSIYANNGVQFVSTGITIVVLWLGSMQVIDKTLTPGTLMIFYSLIGYVLSPVSALINANQTIQDAVIAADRLFQIMDLECEEDAHEKIELSSDMTGDINFDAVDFRYGSRKEVFRQLNLFIPQGKTTAIVGESGSGKSTLASLVQNIYPLNRGRIRIGTYDIKQISNRSLRERIGTVPQQIELFAGTLMENIALGDAQPDMKRIADLIVQLGLTAFVEELPAGLNTYVGEHGVSLSGGERQRVAIARALYRTPDILIFDEATSALDALSEKYVKSVLNEQAQQGKTVIVIAHRLTTVKDADNIIVLHQGKMAEQGRHDALIRERGIYYRLWNEQFHNADEV